MPELTQESTPPEGVAIPPIIDPTAFEDEPTFRETFLLYFPDPGANEALRAVGELLYNMVLEYWQHWPDHPEGLTRASLRAAVGDLRHLQGFLAELATAEEGSPTPHEAHLCRVAGEVSRELATVADRVEKELGLWRG